MLILKCKTLMYLFQNMLVFLHESTSVTLRISKEFWWNSIFGIAKFFVSENFGPLGAGGVHGEVS